MLRGPNIFVLVALVACPLWAGGVFRVLDYGARGDGYTNDVEAITKAFRACKEADGGEVVFSANKTFITSPWVVACNHSVVTIQAGAIVRSNSAAGSTKGWPLGADCPEPSQGLTSKQAAPFILALGVVNVTLRGGGTLDGGGGPFWEEHCGNWWCPKWANRSVSPQQPYAWRPFMLRIENSHKVPARGPRRLQEGRACALGGTQAAA